jgi:hypothetical protein
MSLAKKTTPGNQIKKAIKSTKKDHVLQQNGSYLKEDTVNGKLVVAIDVRNKPLSWFELYIGQLIYAISVSNSYVGVLEIVDQGHAEKLHDMQGEYSYESLAGIGKLIDEMDSTDIDPGIPKDRKDLINDAICNLDEYLKAIQSNFAEESVVGKVLWFLDHEWYDDSLFDYKDHAIELLKILAIPEISKHLIDNKQFRINSFRINGMVKMLERLNSFIMSLSEPCYKAELIKMLLLSCPSQLDDATIMRIAAEAAHKADAARKGISNVYL